MVDMSVSLERQPRIGDVFMMEFYGQGSAQAGCRPGIILQNNIGNKKSPNVVAVPLTSSLKKMNQPTHVFLPKNGTGLKMDSVVLCESPMSVPKKNIGSYLVTIPNHYMRKIARAFLLEHPILCFLNEKDLFSIRQEAYSLIAE